MKIKRNFSRRRKNAPLLACGCLIGAGLFASSCAIVIMLLYPLLPGFGLQALGFDAQGNTAAVFDTAPQSSRPTLDNPQRVAESVVIRAGGYGQQNISSNDAVTVQQGQVDNQPALQITVDENGLLDLCRQYSDTCTPNGERVRNARFDLRPGGLIVYGDYFVAPAGLWQSMGVVLRLTTANRLAVVGLDINGQLYAAPENEMGDLLAEVERTANDMLRQLTVQAGLETYTLDSIYIDDATLTLLMR